MQMQKKTRTIGLTMEAKPILVFLEIYHSDCLLDVDVDDDNHSFCHLPF
jgi:hypothetical protein